MKDRPLKIDDYVRVTSQQRSTGKVGRILEDDGDATYNFWVEYVDGDGDYFCANELARWWPGILERVVLSRTVDGMGTPGMVGVVYEDVPNEDHDFDVIFHGLTNGHDGDANDNSCDHIYCGLEDLAPCDHRPDPRTSFEIRCNGAAYHVEVSRIH